jgi:hypothetical protein
MKATTISSALAAVALLGAVAHGQSTIYGRDLRNGRFITSDTAAFVANLTVIGTNTVPTYAIDFDETATTLWAVENTALGYGTFDLTTGAFTTVGTVTGLTPGSGATGLTCSTNGTWYLSQFVSGVGTNLYVGNITTGTFSLVGLIGVGIMIDISIDSQGNLYGNNISDDNLYSINTTTGAGTLIGPTGQATNFAQGMDFDWSTDTLYATLYTGGGTGVFAAMNLVTGFATILEDTTPTNGEFEIAVRVAAGPSLVTTPYCFGDGSGTACPCGNVGLPGRGCANSHGGGAVLSAIGSASVSAGDLVLVGQFAQPGQPGLYFQGNNATSGGNGFQNGDGLRCAGGGIRRLQIVTAGGAASANPGGSQTSINIAASGLVNPGDTKRYQWWYRNPSPAAPCGTTFNLSNGLEIVWTP